MINKLAKVRDITRSVVSSNKSKLVAGMNKATFYGGATIGMAGIAAYKGINKLDKTMGGDGVGVSDINPFGRKSIQGYGKRGMDANRLNTNGLVQGLHGNRRKV